VVGDQGQIAVVAAPGDLVDADAHERVEAAPVDVVCD